MCDPICSRALNVTAGCAPGCSTAFLRESSTRELYERERDHYACMLLGLGRQVKRRQRLVTGIFVVWKSAGTVSNGNHIHMYLRQALCYRRYCGEKLLKFC